ncbi:MULTISPECIES: T9SS type A sorting domain-containing protein [Hymenobacter]|uniref:T9SS type A sorting domain-containing protein n=1 Tax=Hymenobacter TaxID=89966 RepID=UPI001FD5DAC1|nr:MULTISPECIES: T9SS type A sorting domain-containing protein [Hymenobacter]UOQ82615.1 T9SS type A sorting domain-containing protein [Hymenobacter sp. 5414T-23]
MTASINLEALPAPTAPVATVVQPTCSTATGTVNVTGPVAGYTYTLTGTDPVRAGVTNNAGTFTGVAPGTYSLIATNTAGCNSPGSTVTVNPQPSTPDAPSASLVQPTCTTSTGSVSVTSTTTGLSFTLTGTNPVVAGMTNNTGVFMGVAPGTYSLTASNGTCTSSSTPITIMSPPSTPSTPTASVTQPTCSSSTGSVNVTSETTGLSFTLTGTSPVVAGVTNSTGAFMGVAPGTYNLTASNGSCTSAPRVVTVNPQPSTPDKPAATLVQPTCTEGSGSVTVNPVVGGLSYTLTGTNPARPGVTNTNGQFTSVLPGIYSLTASNGTCTSEARTITIDAAPNTPTAPTASVTQPTCSVATGTVTVSSSTAGMSFTLTGTDPARAPVTNTTGMFMGVLPGMYSLTASNGTCTSGGTPITINTQPGNPTAPEVAVVQPTCALAIGTASVTSTTSGLSFSLVGTNPVRAAVTNSTGVFEGLAAGQYSITASNGTCTSGGTPITINEQPGTPGTPMATVTQPTCTASSGTISITGAVMGYTYTLTGTNPVRAAVTSAGTFNNVAPGQYSLTASNGTCTSGGSPITVNAVPTNCFAEGCTLGYWKNHTNRWCNNYSTSTPYSSIFVNAPRELQGLTLLQALNLQGGGIYNLARQSTAALLNICSSEVAYTSTYPDIATLQRDVNAAYRGNKNGTISSLASALDTYNNAGCPLGGTRATTAATSTSNSTLSGNGMLQGAQLQQGEKALNIYPNPFAHNASIGFTLAEAQRYSVQVYDVSGRMVLRVAEGMAEAGKAYNFQVVANEMPTGVYMVRLTTAKSVQNHRMIISK